MPTISDSLFSLIILIYVGVIFVFMFFAFCWKEPEPPPPDPAHKNIPMITSMLEEMEKAEAAAKAAELEAQEAANGTNEEGTEMKDLNNDKVNVVSETPDNAGEAATSVWVTKEVMSRKMISFEIRAELSWKSASEVRLWKTPKVEIFETTSLY